LFRQSIAEMQSVSVDVLLPLFAHAALQLAKIAEYSGVAEQSAIPLLTMQFSAAAVSWRASCRLIFPFGLTQIASSAELRLLRVVFVILAPQTFRTPPPAVITACVMFELFDFSTPACVPQNPGVRQIVAPQPGGVGFAGTEWHCPLAGSQTSVVQTSVSCVHGVVAPDAHLPVAGTHDSTVQRLLSCAQVSRGPDSQLPFAGTHDSKVHRSPSCAHVFTPPDSHCPFCGLQASTVQRLPSCGHVTGVCLQAPVAGSHEPAEQRLSDAHVFGAPDAHRPVAGSQLSVVQRLPSCEQVIGVNSH